YFPRRRSLLPLARLASRPSSLGPPDRLPLSCRRASHRVVVGIGWPLGLRWRVLLEGLHYHGHRFLQLRIAASAPGVRIELHLDVWVGPVVLDRPAPRGGDDGHVGHAHPAAIDQGGDG